MNAILNNLPDWSRYQVKNFVQKQDSPFLISQTENLDPTQAQQAVDEIDARILALAALDNSPQDRDKAKNVIEEANGTKTYLSQSGAVSEAASVDAEQSMVTYLRKDSDSYVSMAFDNRSWAPPENATASYIFADGSRAYTLTPEKVPSGYFNHS